MTCGPERFTHDRLGESAADPICGHISPRFSAVPRFPTGPENLPALESRLEAPVSAGRDRREFVTGRAFRTPDAGWKPMRETDRQQGGCGALGGIGELDALTRIRGRNEGPSRPPSRNIFIAQARSEYRPAIPVYVGDECVRFGPRRLPRRHDRNGLRRGLFECRKPPATASNP